ncbi:hypothetical protein BpHYR1_001586 [Brachionus plicatilis]|uniref:Uncharacterized protein n=1 Tax=Brachionus plicatilis TaxID=10195 RepID=A0A3M7QK21_BRAPC|nr:hypothetical protein BpHYR1_001586 [Brachionus plicatilis]
MKLIIKIEYSLFHRIAAEHKSIVESLVKVKLGFSSQLLNRSHAIKIIPVHQIVTSWRAGNSI